MSVQEIHYSKRYSDDEHEYRHVILPPDIAKQVILMFITYDYNIIHLICFNLDPEKSIDD